MTFGHEGGYAFNEDQRGGHTPGPTIPPPTTKPPIDIQRAHDLLHSQVTGATPFCFDQNDRKIVRGVLDALCWVLNHDHVTAFGKVLRELEDELKRRGYIVVPIEAAYASKPADEPARTSTEDIRQARSGAMFGDSTD